MQFIVHFGKRKRPTNGEIIKALFSDETFKPNEQYIEGQFINSIYGENTMMSFDVDWWNAPYDIPKKVLDIVD